MRMSFSQQAKLAVSRIGSSAFKRRALPASRRLRSHLSVSGNKRTRISYRSRVKMCRHIFTRLRYEILVLLFPDTLKCERKRRLAGSARLLKALDPIRLTANFACWENDILI